MMDMKKKTGSQFEGGRKKYIWKRIGIGVLAVLLLVVGVVFFLRCFEVNDVLVEGNVHYTDEQIKEIVISEGTWENSVYLSMKYRNRSITDVPFVERMDVTVEDRHTIRVTVYEKSLAGYVSYLGTYMYFDKDGIVVENSTVLTRSVPEVSGLKFNHIVLHEQLPVENPEIFQKILNMTNLLNKHGLSATKIYFDSSEAMTLHFKDVRVILGDEKEIDEKIMRLSAILPSLEDKSGVLHMETYSESAKDITFESDHPEDLLPPTPVEEESGAEESENEEVVPENDA